MLYKFDFEKQPSEERTRGVDFSGAPEIQRGETIDSVNIVVTLNGELVDGILVSHLLTDGNLLLFRYKGGADGNTYKFTMLATTNGGHKIEVDIFMYVREV